MDFEWDDAKSDDWFSHRGSAIRIISALKANGKEVREYEHEARQD